MCVNIITVFRDEPTEKSSNFTISKQNLLEMIQPKGPPPLGPLQAGEGSPSEEEPFLKIQIVSRQPKSHVWSH